MDRPLLFLDHHFPVTPTPCAPHRDGPNPNSVTAPNPREGTAPVLYRPIWNPEEKGHLHTLHRAGMTPAPEPKTKPQPLTHADEKNQQPGPETLPRQGNTTQTQGHALDGSGPPFSTPNQEEKGPWELPARAGRDHSWHHESEQEVGHCPRGQTCSCPHSPMLKA